MTRYMSFPEPIKELKRTHSYHIRKRPISLHCSGSKEEITCPLSGKSSPSIPHPLCVCFPGFILTDFTCIQMGAEFIQFEQIQVHQKRECIGFCTLNNIARYANQDINLKQIEVRIIHCLN